MISCAVGREQAVGKVLKLRLHHSGAMAEDSKVPASRVDNTAHIIAYLMIGFFGIALLTIGIVASFHTSDANNAWLDLFKSGFLILGGGLTTIIGYYFGSRGTEEAQKAADSALQQMDTMRQDVSGMKAEADRLRELVENLSSMAPTLDEDALEVPENIVSEED